ncbi:mechanosensitive ion channel family protein [Alkalimonas collagenimarina]|uniref:Mechanosensitive ion channel family protein n=2 Tax=Alkalimonas collagenimarina TaxID=400390 RepID=A0ABT9GY37_9GAMM|nr:mechanosensitive ion channel family protein [Alkalimonas collagenimarina]MDP4535971.1 mechanosensitive ion channel family protein [Alkalimonas collagenimarina]
MASSLAGLVLLSWLANWLTKNILVRAVSKAFNATPFAQNSLQQDFGIIARLSNVVPALVLAAGVGYIRDVPEPLVEVVRNVSNGFIVLTIAMALSNVLTMVNTLYERRPNSRTKPIKGYIQLLKIIIYTVAFVLIVAMLINRSPLILLSGMGAMMAVMLLIFQDTILSVVASIQIASNDVIRVGDWVEMPQLNADGDVIDIALHTVKIQNWDRTITTIPTRRFMTDPFKNWRGMQQSGGRRIKRSLMIDQQSVHFISAEERSRLNRFRLLQEYLPEKEQEIKAWNESLKEQGQEPVNTRRITNLGSFRAYVERYLRSHQHVHQHMTLIVRQLAPTPDGLPLEIYCFTNTTAWVAYEGIQSDIFDHLFAILPEFGLRMYQHPSGLDLRQIKVEGLMPANPQD